MSDVDDNNDLDVTPVRDNNFDGLPSNYDAIGYRKREGRG